jgi:hypothetical protein
VLEASGTPPHSGTNVTFTTSLGTVQPSEASTDTAGRAIVTFVAGTASGTATITAISGGAGGGTAAPTTGTTGTTTTTAANSVKIAVGAAAVGKVIVNANPSLVPARGGSSLISANIIDTNGNVLSSVPVTFSTTAGTLSAQVVNTDASGVPQTVLATTTQAVVTASVGAAATTPPATGGTTGGSTSTATSGTVTVGIANAPTLNITAPATPPSAGLPAAFTFVVTSAATNGSAVKDVSVNWGDGQVQDLGAITGSQAVSHVYHNAGTFVISATLTDTAGNVQPVSTSVVVIPVPRPTIIIQQSPVPGHINTPTTLTVQITVAAGIGIQDTKIDFGDGSSADLGGAGSFSQPHVYTSTGTFTVTVTVIDTSGQTTQGTAVVSITI